VIAFAKGLPTCKNFPKINKNKHVWEDTINWQYISYALTCPIFYAPGNGKGIIFAYYSAILLINPAHVRA
jgi:hypothetical protein